MNNRNEPPAPTQPQYQIIISGQLDAKRSAWFDGMEIEYTEGMTILSGTLVDPQALFGVIERIRDLGLSLIEVRQKF